MSVWMAALLCAAGAELSHSAVAQIREVHTVHLEKPLLLYRDGAPKKTQDPLILRLRVTDLTPFVPRNVAPGRVMLGHGVCEVLQPPITNPDLVVACPQPPEGDSAPVWVLDMVNDPRDLRREDVQALLARSKPPHPLSAALKRSDLGRFATVAELRKAIAAPARKKP
jgi:hypothetical protein